MLTGNQMGGLIGLQIVTLLISAGAFVIALFVNRRAESAKKFDMRLSLGRETNNIRIQAAEVAAKLEQLAHHASPASSDADIKADRLVLDALLAKLPASYESLFKQTRSELAAESLRMHIASLELTRLKKKYFT